MSHWLDRISPVLRQVGRGMRAFAQNWVEPLRVIYDHQLVLFGDSEFVVEVGRERCPCPPGSFIVLPPGLWHVTRAVGSSPGSRYWVHFDWQCLDHEVESPILTYHPAAPQPQLYRPAPSGVPQAVLRGTMAAPQETLELHERLLQRWRFGSPLQRRSARALLLQMLIELLDTRSGSGLHVALEARVASKTRAVLDRIAGGPVSAGTALQDRLRRLGRSYAHQARLFRQEYGVPPGRYVQALRMTRARDLLRDTDLSVSEIARRVGFGNLHYFSRLFRRHEGVSAREFRARLR